MYYSRVHMPRHGLGELEQVLLFALLRLGGDSYGAMIRAEVLETTGRSITPGAIYPTLDRLEARGLLVSRMGEPRAERGGRACRYFKATAAGVAEARRAWGQMSALTAGVRALKATRGDV